MKKMFKSAGLSRHSHYNNEKNYTRVGEFF